MATTCWPQRSAFSITARPANRRRSCTPARAAPNRTSANRSNCGSILPSSKPVPPMCRRGKIDRSPGSRPRFRSGKAARCLAGQTICCHRQRSGISTPLGSRGAQCRDLCRQIQPACRRSSVAEHAAVSPNAAEAFFNRSAMASGSLSPPASSIVPRPTATTEIRTNPGASSRPAATARRPLPICRATSSRRAAVARIGRKGRRPRAALPPAWTTCRRTLIFPLHHRQPGVGAVGLVGLGRGIGCRRRRARFGFRFLVGRWRRRLNAGCRRRAHQPSVITGSFMSAFIDDF